MDNFTPLFGGSGLRYYDGCCNLKTISTDKAIFSSEKKLISFLLNKNKCFWYLLEAPQRGTSNEYHNICIRRELRKILCEYPPLICSYVKTFKLSTSVPNALSLVGPLSSTAFFVLFFFCFCFCFCFYYYYFFIYLFFIYFFFFYLFIYLFFLFHLSKRLSFMFSEMSH